MEYLRVATWVAVAVVVVVAGFVWRGRKTLRVVCDRPAVFMVIVLPVLGMVVSGAAADVVVGVVPVNVVVISDVVAVVDNASITVSALPVVSKTRYGVKGVAPCVLTKPSCAIIPTTT